MCNQENKKTCKYCGKEKHTKDFHRDSGQEDGLCLKCKSCVKKDYDRRKEERKSIVAPEGYSKECLKCGESKYKDEFNKDRSSRDGLDIYCRECSIQNKRRATNERPDWKKKFYSIKNNSNRKGRPLNISEVDFKEWWESTPNVCSCCGSTIDQYIEIREASFANESPLSVRVRKITSGTVGKSNLLTVERKDSTKPYSKGNMEKTCWICNKTKGELIPFDVAKEIMKGIIDNIREELSLSKIERK